MQAVKDTVNGAAEKGEHRFVLYPLSASTFGTDPVNLFSTLLLSSPHSHGRHSYRERQDASAQLVCRREHSGTASHHLLGYEDGREWLLVLPHSA
jgi:hypothetical protein